MFVIKIELVLLIEREIFLTSPSLTERGVKPCTQPVPPIEVKFCTMMNLGTKATGNMTFVKKSSHTHTHNIRYCAPKP